MRSIASGQSSVRQRFLRITAPLIFLSVMGVFSIIETLAHRNAVFQLDVSTDQLIRTEAASMVNPLWNLDTRQIQLRLEAIAANREVVIARAYDEEDHFITQAGNPSQQDTVSAVLERDVFRTSDASPPRKIGRLEIEVSDSEIWQQTRNRLILAGCVALLAVSMEVGAALFALRQIVGRPLAQLLDAINSEKAGEHRQRVDVQAMDEMGQVIESFNEMLDQQDIYENELEERTRMESELGIGRDLQLAMVPRDFSDIVGDHPISIWGELEPAREVGGDFYDAFFLDDNLFCFCIGDVADKGVPAALYMAVTKTLTRAFAVGQASPAVTVMNVNEELCRAKNRGMFVTLFVAVLDIRSGLLRYTNAGHNPPFLRCQSGQVTKLSDRNGPVVGAKSRLNFTESTVLLAPGDMLLLYTDGVTEAKAPDDTFFGEDKLKHLFHEVTERNARQLAKDILRAVEQHEGAGDRTDDVTLFTLLFEGQLKERWVGEYPALPDAFTGLNAAIIDALNDQQKGVVAKTQLVLDEVCSNIANHGNPGRDLSFFMNISLGVIDNQILIRVSDNTPAFDPERAPRPDITARLDERPIGGLGLHLVRRMTAGFRYARENNKNVYRILICDHETQLKSPRMQRVS